MFFTWLTSKYTMQLLNQRLSAEWQDLHVTYPLWVSMIVLDEVYYVTALVAVCACCFAVGLAMGFIVALV